MKKKFSNKWIASKQIRKQRKYRYNAPLHVRQKFMTANLSKELRVKMKKRNIILRKGDKVKIMRGEFFKKEGKVILVDLKKSRIAVEGIQRQKKDGTKINVFFSPSKVQIILIGDERKTNVENKPKPTKELEGEKNAPKKT